MDLFEEDSQRRLDTLLGDSLELSTEQKTKIASLEKELEDRRNYEEKNKERKKAVALDTGIPYNMVDIDVIKIATMVGMIKSKSVLEGKKKDTSMSLIDILFGNGSSPSGEDKGPTIPFYYQPAINTVTESDKINYHSRAVQAECEIFTTMATAHIQKHLSTIREHVVIDIDKLSVPSFVKTCKSTMDMLIESLEDETSKKEIDETLHVICLIRNSLFGPISIANYIELVKEQLMLFKQLKIQKKLITKNVSSIDSFLTLRSSFSHKSFSETCVDALKRELDFRCHQNDPKLKPFDMYEITKECCTPSLACVDVEHLLSKCFLGPYHNNPVVYLNLSVGNNRKVHWAFYILKEITNGKRLWVIDHSLIKTSHELATVLMTYTVQLFRTLHCVAFGDNTYRQGFLKKTVIGPLLKTLVKNILFVNNASMFREFLAYLVMTKSTITPTDNDLFNSQKNTPYNHADLVSKVSKNDHKLIKSLFDETSKYSITFLSNDLKSR